MDSSSTPIPTLAVATTQLQAAAVDLADAIEQATATERAFTAASERLARAKTAYNRALNALVGSVEPRLQRNERQLLRDGHVRQVDIGAMPSAEVHFASSPAVVSRPAVLMPRDVVALQPLMPIHPH